MEMMEQMKWQFLIVYSDMFYRMLSVILNMLGLSQMHENQSLFSQGLVVIKGTASFAEC